MLSDFLSWNDAYSFNAGAGLDHSVLTLYNALISWGFEYPDITAEGKFELLRKTMCVTIGLAKFWAPGRHCP